MRADRFTHLFRAFRSLTKCKRCNRWQNEPQALSAPDAALPARALSAGLNRCLFFISNATTAVGRRSRRNSSRADEEIRAGAVRAAAASGLAIRPASRTLPLGTAAVDVAAALRAHRRFKRERLVGWAEGDAAVNVSSSRAGEPAGVRASRRSHSISISRMAVRASVISAI